MPAVSDLWHLSLNLSNSERQNHAWQQMFTWTSTKKETERKGHLPSLASAAHPTWGRFVLGQTGPFSEPGPLGAPFPGSVPCGRSMQRLLGRSGIQGTFLAAGTIGRGGLIRELSCSSAFAMP